jgi:hypothetical protein
MASSVMVAEKNRIVDGLLTAEGGVDSGFSPSLIQPNQLAWAVNTTVRGGFPKARPGIWVKNLTFDDPEALLNNGYYNAAVESAFKTGYFQGCGSYINDQGEPYLYVAISGKIFQIDIGNNFRVTDRTPQTGTFQVNTRGRVSNVATYVTAGAHGLFPGMVVRLPEPVGALYPEGFFGDFVVQTIPSPTTFTTYSPGIDAGPLLGPSFTAYILAANNPNADHVYFQQAENWLIIQDQQNAPYLYDGTSFRRAASDEVPVGGPMAYGKGRLWVAKGSEYYGGDLVYGDPAYGRNSVIRFTENTFLNEGGAFAVSNGPITGLAFAANLDTSLGDGDLLVFTPTATYAFNAPVDRDVWKDLNYPIQRFALLNFGSFNHESIVPVNGDLFFRAQDGIRSLIYARRDFTEFGNTPISRQVVRALAYDTEFYLTAASAVNFDNRMLMTIQPQKVNGRGVVHRGMVVMDFDLVSGMGRKLPPAWEGVWTGVDILQMLTARIQKQERCFVFGLNQGDIGLYEVTKNGQFDFDGFDDAPIDWTIETRSLTFAEPTNKKRLVSAEQWYDQVMGDIESKVYFKANEGECWQPWAEFKDCAKYRNCEPGEISCPPAVINCQEVKYYQPPTRSRIALPQPPDKCDVQTGGFTRDGYEFQLRYVNTGRFRLKRVAMVAQRLQEDIYGDLSRVACPLLSA